MAKDKFVPNKKKKADNTRVLLSIPSDLMETVNKKANEYEMSKSNYIVECILYALKHTD